MPAQLRQLIVQSTTQQRLHLNRSRPSRERPLAFLHQIGQLSYQDCLRALPIYAQKHLPSKLGNLFLSLGDLPLRQVDADEVGLRQRLGHGDEIAAAGAS